MNINFTLMMDYKSYVNNERIRKNFNMVKKWLCIAKETDVATIFTIREIMEEKLGRILAKVCEEDESFINRDYTVSFLNDGQILCYIENCEEACSRYLKFGQGGLLYVEKEYSSVPSSDKEVTIWQCSGDDEPFAEKIASGKSHHERPLENILTGAKAIHKETTCIKSSNTWTLIYESRCGDDTTTHVVTITADNKIIDELGLDPQSQEVTSLVNIITQSPSKRLTREDLGYCGICGYEVAEYTYETSSCLTATKIEEKSAITIEKRHNNGSTQIDLCEYGTDDKEILQKYTFTINGIQSAQQLPENVENELLEYVVSLTSDIAPDVIANRILDIIGEDFELEMSYERKDNDKGRVSCKGRNLIGYVFEKQGSQGARFQIVQDPSAGVSMFTCSIPYLKERKYTINGAAKLISALIGITQESITPEATNEAVKPKGRRLKRSPFGFEVRIENLNNE